ncbi:DUF1850 domain-containing protein [Defluviimonas sp. SAOS-178_SWC]|uniref:DUF1850 domain-containing protein n=1 Tax=Defluviimonas sp. SAOS-178_SWC TaxID=3121287 RepID=UPI003221CD2E
MTGPCLLVGATMLTLASGSFDLTWRHSVEKTEWRESWRIEGRTLRLTEAAVKGSGAGMDPGPGARLEDGWWIWTPDLPPVPDLTLAASGATGGGWRLCDADTCHEIGERPGTAIRLAPCPD